MSSNSQINETETATMYAGLHSTCKCSPGCSQVGESAKKIDEIPTSPIFFISLENACMQDVSL